MMGEPTQISFSLREIAELLIKEQGLHEGRWMLGVEFGFSVALAGNSPETAGPSAVAQVAKMILSAIPSDAPEDIPLTFDAAIVNPKPA